MLHGGLRSADDPVIAGVLAGVAGRLRSALIVVVDRRVEAELERLTAAYASLAITCTVATISRHAALIDAHFVGALSAFDVVHLAGGSAPRIAEVLRATPLERALRNCRCVVAESGAAMALGAWALGCPDSVDPPAPGLGWLAGYVVDAHFNQSGRTTRLEELLALNPTLVGVGIDEATALLVDGVDNPPGRTIGAGSVRVLHGSASPIRAADTSPSLVV